MSRSESMNQVLQSEDGLWFCVGPVSSFPDLASSTKSSPSQKLELSTSIPCTQDGTISDTTQSPAAKIFQIPKSSPTSTSTDPPFRVAQGEAESSAELEQQVLVFQHRGKFHAVDHQCPHRSYPLSRGSVYDIEDFGIVLSAGVMCPKHGWAFDLFTGDSDRGAYQLRIWNVEVRERKSLLIDDGSEEVVREVWVRKR